LVCGRASDSEDADVEALVREFLANEYRIVRERLAANRALLDDVAERLMWDPVVDQDELADICKKHGVEIAQC
jgi:ATP-dependent Zn protease